MRYTVVIEQAPNNYCAYLPEWPWAVGVGDTREEAIESIRESILIHLEDARENGEPSREDSIWTDDADGYLVVAEVRESATGASYASYAPDIPGCEADGETREQAVERIREAVRRRLADADRNGAPRPKRGVCTATVEVAPSAERQAAESLSA